MTEPEDPVMPSRKSRCEACIACDQLRDDAGAANFALLHARRLESPAELEAFPGLTINTDEQHIADHDGIEAFYDFDREVRCSLRGGHGHKSGLVATMLCRMTICMGHDCGEKWIVGYRRLRKRVDAQKNFESDLRRITGFAADFRERLELLKRELNARRKIHDDLKERVPKLYQELQRRKRLTGVQRIEVRGMPGQLVGIEIVDAEKYDHVGFQAQVEAFEERRARLDRSDVQAVGSLAKTATAIDKRFDRAKDWIRETAGFVAESNLRLALEALAARDQRIGSHSVEKTSSGWRVKYFGVQGAELREMSH